MLILKGRTVGGGITSTFDGLEITLHLADVQGDGNAYLHLLSDSVRVKITLEVLDAVSQGGVRGGDADVYDMVGARHHRRADRRVIHEATGD